MSNPDTNALLDKLVTPVILMVIAFLGTWMFTINTDVAIMQTKMEKVDAMALDQRTADRMLILLETQTKANTELVNEVRNSQRELTDAMTEMKLAFAKWSGEYSERNTTRPRR